MPNLDPAFVSTASIELAKHDIDGWLLYDFRARNPIAANLVGIPEGQKRRYFVLVEPGVPPVALVQKIEVSGWDGWPHELKSYVGWDEMEEKLAAMLEGMHAVAMEVSPVDSIPYVDNVPAGVQELVESLGPTVVSSVDLISSTAAQWGERGYELHIQASDILVRTARAAFELAAQAVGLAAQSEPTTEDGYSLDGEPTPSTEFELAESIRSRLASEGLTDADTIVAVGPNAAKPHYFPPEVGSSTFSADEVFMVDLWGRVADQPEAVFADQTWMGFLGPKPPADVIEGWEAAVQMAQRLRGAGVGCMTPISERPMGAQMRRADKAGARFALFVGADELAAGRFGLKNLRTGEQVDVSETDVATRVKEGHS